MRWRRPEARGGQPVNGRKWWKESARLDLDEVGRSGSCITQLGHMSDGVEQAFTHESQNRQETLRVLGCEVCMAGVEEPDFEVRPTTLAFGFVVQ